MVLLGKLNKKTANIALLITALILFNFNIYELDYSNFSWETNRNDLFRLISNIMLILLFALNLRKIKKAEKETNYTCDYMTDTF